MIIYQKTTGAYIDLPNFQGGRSPKYLHKLWLFEKIFNARPIVKNKSA